MRNVNALTFHFGSYIYRPQRSWGKVMFLQASVILLTGGEYLTRYTPPRPGTPPDQYIPQTRSPPKDQVHPPDQVPPSGDQVLPPQDQVHPPQTRYIPRDQVHPPGPGTPPPGPGRYGLRGRYASYWNAFLLCFTLKNLYAHCWVAPACYIWQPYLGECTCAQCSHSDWINGKVFSSRGILKNQTNTGEVRQFQTNIIHYNFSVI